MATKVVDLEVQKLPSGIDGLENYTNALILFRLNGRPIGQSYLRPTDGHISGGELFEALREATGRQLWNRWLHHHLGVEQPYSTGSSNYDATIAVCTRDRPDDLKRCMEALLKIRSESVEVLVVDNCPPDEKTRRLVKGYDWVRYVREDRPGLNCARNRALREAKHPIVAFIDDDAVPDPGWLRALLSNFDDPLVLCTTGLTMPLELETEAQEWFERMSGFGRGFERKVFESSNHNPFAFGPMGSGVNMALRRSVLDHIGPFNEAMDAGTPTHSGGDYEMFSRIMAAGYRIVYDPAALNWHRHRRTWKELRHVLYGYGVGVYAAFTHGLLVDKEISMLKIAWQWFFHEQGPNLVRALLGRPGSPSLDLVLAELCGCLVGPGAYLYSRRRHSEGQ